MTLYLHVCVGLDTDICTFVQDSVNELSSTCL